MTPAERRAVGETLMAHRTAVVAWLRSFGVHENEREDAMQTVFTAAVARWQDYRAAEPLGPWLYGIVRRVASNWRRTQQRRPVVLVEHIAVFGAHTIDGPIEARSDLRALPEHLRPLLRAMAEDGFTAAAGARGLNVDPDAVHVRLVELRCGLPVLSLVPRTKRHER